jgi:putative peptidoglycan lipid II flippase
VNLLLIRTFFSLQRPWVPTAIALTNLFLNAGLDAVLYGPMGVGGIVLATAIVSLMTAVALAAVLRPELGGLDGRHTLDATLRILAASALLAGTALTVKLGLDGVVSDDFAGQLLVIVGAGCVGTAAYIAAVFTLGVKEAHQIRTLLSEQVARLRA